MNPNSPYQEMNELLLSLEAAVARIQEGKLNAEELHEAVEWSRELYERLLIIRHKVFEDELGSATISAKNIPFTVPPVPRNQTSLIDAIEEVEQEQTVKSPLEEIDLFAGIQEEEKPAFVPFSEPVQEESPEPVEEVEIPEITEPEGEAEKEEEETEAPVVLEEISEESADEEELVAEEPKTEESPGTATSLAEKLERSPIADLKSAIGLNQKFQFINTLFEGDPTKYDKAISLLNDAESLKIAQDWTSSNLPGSFEDEDEQNVLEKFIELVERRHA